MPICRDRILYCDDAMLAVNKLAGELVVRGAGNVQKLPLLDFLKKEYPGLRPLNRLDFETSGVVVFARNKTALADALKSKFRGWKKIYRTIVSGRIKDNRGEINMPLPARVKGGSVSAISRYTVIQRFKNASYLEVAIETGRHHQIRRHFQMIHHPLVLDAIYGDEKFNRQFIKYAGYRRFFLHALKVSLPHPITGKEITIVAEMPKVFEEALKKL